MRAKLGDVKALEAFNVDDYDLITDSRSVQSILSESGIDDEGYGLLFVHVNVANACYDSIIGMYCSVPWLNRVAVVLQ